jgi:hypothetical protein
MNKKFWLGWFLLVGSLVIGNVKCGYEKPISKNPESQNLAPQSPAPQIPAPLNLTGVMEVQSLVVPAGTTQVIEKDLAIFASKDIQIDGSLNIKEGVNLILMAQGTLTINGRLIGEAPVSKLRSQILFIPRPSRAILVTGLDRDQVTSAQILRSPLRVNTPSRLYERKDHPQRNPQNLMERDAKSRSETVKTPVPSRSELFRHQQVSRPKIRKKAKVDQLVW